MEYTDCITFENIDEENLITIETNGEIYNFDALTLYRYKKEASEYLNPFTKQKLDDGTIKKIESCMKENYNYLVIVFFNNSCNGKYELYLKKKVNITFIKFLENFTKYYKMFDYLLASDIYILDNTCTNNIYSDDILEKNINDYNNITIMFKVYLDIEDISKNIKKYEKYFKDNNVYKTLINYIEEFDELCEYFIENAENDDVEEILSLYSLPLNGLNIISNNNFKIMYKIIDKGKRNVLIDIVNEFLLINMSRKFIDDIVLYMLINKKLFILPTLISYIIDNSIEISYQNILQNISKIDTDVIKYFISMLTDLHICEFFNYNNCELLKYFISTKNTDIIELCKPYFTIETLDELKNHNL